MADQPQGDLGSPETSKNIWNFYRNQTRLLTESTTLVNKQESRLWGVVAALLLSVNETNGSLLWLARNRKARDAYVLSRTVLETIINTCFILANGPETAEKAWRHANQKAYRDLDRTVRVNEKVFRLKWTGRVDLAQHPELMEAIREYTSKKGREITSWTPETVNQRIEAIDKKYGNRATTSLQLALLAIYRHSSEISHGTLFGAMQSIGLLQPPGPPNNLEQMIIFRQKQVNMLCLMLGASIDSLLWILGKELGDESFAQKSSRAMSKLRESPGNKLSGE